MNVQEENSQNTVLLVSPKDTLLQTYNVLTLKDPNDILDFLINPLAEPLPDSMVNDGTGIKVVKADYQQAQSLDSVRQQFASSVGLSADFAAFNASFQSNFKTDTLRTVTNFDASCHMNIDFGSTSINFNDHNQILGLMNDSFKDQLANINSLSDAANFVESYGTHLVAGVGLGGNLCIAIHADSTTVKTKTEISNEINTAFSGLENSVSSVIKAVNKTAKEHKEAHVSLKLVAIGGNPGVLDPYNPESIHDWDETCDADSIRNVSRSIPIWELADTNAKTWLERYIYYKMLETSLTKPRIFSSLASVNSSPFAHSCGVDSGYRIIGGGAMVNMHSTNFLTSSYPQLNNDGNIESWGTISDNLAARNDNDYLAAYAIGAFDPKNLMDIKVDTAQGTGLVGKDSAKAKLRDFYTLTGGGTFTKMKIENQPLFFKYITGSYPGDDNRSWVSEVCNFENAKAPTEIAELTSYAIGINNDPGNYLSVDSHTATASTSVAVSHGDETAGGNHHLCSGGVKLDEPDTKGVVLNLVQASYPKRGNAWREYNKSIGKEHVAAVSTVYANWLEAYLNLE